MIHFLPVLSRVVIEFQLLPAARSGAEAADFPPTYRRIRRRLFLDCSRNEWQKTEPNATLGRQPPRKRESMARDRGGRKIPFIFLL